jgi:hypothetical protein
MKFKKELLLSSLFIGIFFTLTQYGNAKIECKNIYKNAGETPVDDELCQVVGYNEIAGRAFPNGSIIKKKNYPQVYYIENFQKRAIESPALFESRGFDWNGLIISSEGDIDQIPDGPVLTFRDGSLLSNRGNVYIISDGLKRPIDSPAAFLRLGFKWNNVKAVSDAEINIHPLGERVTTSSAYPDGVVIKTGGGKMYLVDDDKRRYVPSPLIFESQFKWNEAVDLSLAVAPVYNPSEKGDVTIRDGVLMAGEGKVWVTENNKKVPIFSPEIFESMRLSWGQIKPATAFDLAIMPTNNASNIGKNIRVFADGTALKADNSPQIYYSKAGVLRPINTPERFFQTYFSFNEVITVPERVIKQYPIGSEVPPAPGL